MLEKGEWQFFDPDTLQSVKLLVEERDLVSASNLEAAVNDKKGEHSL